MVHWRPHIACMSHLDAPLALWLLATVHVCVAVVGGAGVRRGETAQAGGGGHSVA